MTWGEHSAEHSEEESRKRLLLCEYFNTILEPPYSTISNPYYIDKIFQEIPCASNQELWLVELHVLKAIETCPYFIILGFERVLEIASISAVIIHESEREERLSML